jgi:hypothetical protein
MATKKKQAKKFNYAVGFYWEGDSGSVGCYAYGSEHFYGTMEDAQNFLKYVQDQQLTKKKADRKDYKIFQLVEVPV